MNDVWTAVRSGSTSYKDLWPMEGLTRTAPVTVLKKTISSNSCQ